MILFEPSGGRVGAAAGGHLYSLAGEGFLCPVPVPELAPFADGSRGEPATVSAAISRSCAGATYPRTLFAGKAWIGGQWCEVECRHGESGYRIEVPGACPFAINRDGGRITALGAGWTPGDRASTQVLLGPAALLALALRGVYALHASAVALIAPGQDPRALAFLGLSGSGKSTLAATLPGGRAEPALSRLADDILPLRIEGGRAVALPWFPQLKLSRQPGVTFPPRLPLSALYLLSDHRDDASISAIVRHPLSARERVLALVRHTVAARLFAPDLLTRHLDAMISLARLVPPRRLDYPWKPEVWPELRRVLATV